MLLSAILACSGTTEDSATPAAAEEGSELQGSGVITCASPELRASEGPLYRADLPTEGLKPGGPGTGCGGSIADLDGDGSLDLLWACQSNVAVLMGTGAGFVDETDARWPDALPRAVASSVVDFDDDGDLDVLLLSRGGPDALYRNDGTGTFTVASDVGLSEVALASTGGVWMDGDADGDLDLLISSHDSVDWDPDNPTPGEPSQLYENDDGVLIDRSDRLPQTAQDGHTFLTAWMDLTDDGRPDLFMLNDHGPLNQPNLLLKSTGALTFEIDEGDHGLDLAAASMGLGVGDINGDLWPDFMLPQWGVGLVESDAAGNWYHTNGIRGLNVDFDLAAWGTELADLDNDTDLDALVVFGHLPASGEQDNPEEQPDMVFEWESGFFVERGEDWGMADPGWSRGLALADINRDGFLDALIGMLDEPPRLHLSRCDERAWLNVRLEQPAPNRRAIGATVEAITEDAHQIRWVMAGGTGLFSSNPAEVHFGLGEAESVDLTVTWPDGTVESWSDVPSRQHVVVTRP